MSGRGGYYGSLHPAYQPFNVSSEFSSPSTRHSTAATVSDTSHSKLDAITSLLQSQQENITSLRSEVTFIPFQVDLYVFVCFSLDERDEGITCLPEGKKKCLSTLPYQSLAHTVHESYSEVRQFDQTKL